MQTRIIAGDKKGMKLNNPLQGTRPLTDRIKTSLFDLISDFINDARVLDLYAGGGNFGIEALSRGANTATFVDLAEESIQCIKQNLLKTGLLDHAQLNRNRVEDFLSHSDKTFDLIMADPPFPEVDPELIREISPLLEQEGLLIFRHPSEIESPEQIYDLEKVYEKKYGVSILTFYKKLPKIH